MLILVKKKDAIKKSQWGKEFKIANNSLLRRFLCVKHMKEIDRKQPKEKKIIPLFHAAISLNITVLIRQQMS